jgi:hypothetical protein
LHQQIEDRVIHTTTTPQSIGSQGGTGFARTNCGPAMILSRAS